MAQYRQGKYASALENMRQVVRYEPEDGALHFVLACLYARLADPDRALFHLDKAREQLGFSLLAHISEPNLDSLRETPQFKEIVRQALQEYRRNAPAQPVRPPPETEEAQPAP